MAHALLAYLSGVLRPSNPTTDDAADLVRKVTGQAPKLLEWTAHVEPSVDVAGFERMVARRCAVGEDRLHDVGFALHRVPVPDHTRVVASVWPVTQCVIGVHARKEREGLLENP
jgi:hypothetical protein